MSVGLTVNSPRHQLTNIKSQLANEITHALVWATENAGQENDKQKCRAGKFRMRK